MWVNGKNRDPVTFCDIFYLNMIHVYLATCKICCYLILIVLSANGLVLRGGLSLTEHVVAHPYFLNLFQVPKTGTALRSLGSLEADTIPVLFKLCLIMPTVWHDYTCNL